MYSCDIHVHVIFMWYTCDIYIWLLFLLFWIALIDRQKCVIKESWHCSHFNIKLQRTNSIFKFTSKVWRWLEWRKSLKRRSNVFIWSFVSIPSSPTPDRSPSPQSTGQVLEAVSIAPSSSPKLKLPNIRSLSKSKNQVMSVYMQWHYIKLQKKTWNCISML